MLLSGAGHTGTQKIADRHPRCKTVTRSFTGHYSAFPPLICTEATSVSAATSTQCGFIGQDERSAAFEKNQKTHFLTCLIADPAEEILPP